MDTMEHLMWYYDKGIDELMGAKEYVDDYEEANSAEDKSMFRTMAHQEMEHSNNMLKAGDRLLAGMPPEDPLHKVWHHLKKHLHEWRSSLEMRLSDK